MKVLITGHGGYIGAVMVPVLQAAGHEVAGLETGYFDECRLGESPISVSTLRKDLRDVTAKDLQGFEAVVHLAALSNDPLGELNPHWTEEINYTASVRLAQLAKEAGVERFLYSSSCSIYGVAGEEELATEEAPLKPLTAYALSKVRTEEGLSRLADSHFCPVFMRNATAYGLSPRFRADLVLNNLVCWALTTGAIRILSDGCAWRPMVHVQDISLAFAVVLGAPRELVHNQAFNVGQNEENYQVRQMAEIVRETIPGCRIEYAAGGQPDPRNYRVDFGKLSRTLVQFKPKWNARLGAQEMYSACQQAGLTLNDLHGRKYIRLKQLKYLLDSGRLDNTLRWKTA